ncbi:hypothetical protein [Aureimonas sp. AU4]|uniref:hypothetical protein n=1 Tax=Aureimonas sp. AU4 TaxID=1638163 RepID=UPI000782AC2A|nr:hypothetical protein [Aureimonas sp. AU4]
MLSARTERFGYVSSHLRAPVRRPVTGDRSRPSARSLHGTGRLMMLDIESANLASTLASSRFEAAAPQRF